MSVSSRTPEGDSHRCPVCGKISSVQPSYPNGDSCCPSCGHLLWWFRDHLGRHSHLAPESIALSTSITRLDSLEIVELVMELEEEFGVQIPDDEAERIKTVADLIRYIELHRKK